MTMLKVEGVTKKFGGLIAVNNVSLSVETGEIFGIIGPNGAGKTTLLNLISGVYGCDDGRIYIEKERIDQLRPNEIAKKGIARTFQIPRPFRKMTVLENMLVPAFAIFPERDVKKIESRAIELLDLVGLTGLKNEYGGNLSGGQQRLLDFVRALMLDPKIMLLDEVSSGVHPTLEKKIIRLIKMMRSEGKSVVMISHDIAFLMPLCDRVAFMNVGRKVIEGTPDEIKKSKLVIDAYLGGRSDVA